MAVLKSGTIIGGNVENIDSIVKVYGDGVDATLGFGHEDSTASHFFIGTDYDDSRKFKISRFEDLSGNELVMDGEGRIGVGIGIPLDKLHVAGNIRIDDDYVLNFSTDGQIGIDSTGNLTFYDVITGLKTLAELAAGAAGTPPGGANTNIQFNDTGVFGGSANFTYIKATGVAYISGKLGIGMAAINELDVTGSIAASSSIEYNGAAEGIRIRDDNIGLGNGTLIYEIYDEKDVSIATGRNVVFGSRTGVPYALLDDNEFHIYSRNLRIDENYEIYLSEDAYITDSTSIIIISKGGNDIVINNIGMGFGTISPTEKIHVQDGNILIDNGHLEGDVLLQTWGVSTYDYLNDLINNTLSSGYFGDVNLYSVGGADVGISSGYGLIKDGPLTTDQSYLFDWVDSTSCATFDEQMNYIYVQYNVGGSPSFGSTNDPETLGYHTDKFIIGVAFRDGNELHIMEGGQRLDNFIHDVYHYAWEALGFQRASGCMTTEAGARKLNITPGVIFWFFTKFTQPEFDSDIGGDTFTYFYSDGGVGWTRILASTTIDNLQYDDGSGVLQPLTSNRYGVHWVFEDLEGHIFIVYGQGNYVLADALDANIPASLPPLAGINSILIAKIIVQQNTANLHSIYTPWTSEIQGQVVTDHTDLAGLLVGDDHTQYAILAGRDGGQNIRGGTAANEDLYLEGTIHGTKGDVLINANGGNVGIGGTSFGTNANKVFSINTGTAPTTSPADIFQIYSDDLDGIPGKGSFHLRVEDGTIIKLGHISKFSDGDFQGTVYGGTPTLHIDGDYELSEDQVRNLVLYVDATAACIIDLPSVALCIEGANLTVMVTTAFVVSLNPDNSDRIVLNGTSLDDGDQIDSPGAAGNMVTIHRDSEDGWTTLGRAGVWVDGG